MVVIVTSAIVPNEDRKLCDWSIDTRVGMASLDNRSAKYFVTQSTTIVALVQVTCPVVMLPTSAQALARVGFAMLANHAGLGYFRTDGDATRSCELIGGTPHADHPSDL